MANHNSIPLATLARENDFTDSSATFIETFREGTDTVSSPDEWLSYIDILKELYPGHRMFGLFVVDLLPEPVSNSPHNLRILRREREAFKPNDACAILTLMHGHATSPRIAIATGITLADPLVIRRAHLREGNIVTQPLPNGELLVKEFDRCLKTYRSVQEIVRHAE